MHQQLKRVLHNDSRVKITGLPQTFVAVAHAEIPVSPRTDAQCGQPSSNKNFPTARQLAAIAAPMDEPN